LSAYGVGGSPYFFYVATLTWGASHNTSPASMRLLARDLFDFHELPSPHSGAAAAPRGSSWSFSSFATSRPGDRNQSAPPSMQAPQHIPDSAGQPELPATSTVETRYKNHQAKMAAEKKRLMGNPLKCEPAYAVILPHLGDEVRIASTEVKLPPCTRDTPEDACPFHPSFKPRVGEELEPMNEGGGSNEAGMAPHERDEELSGTAEEQALEAMAMQAMPLPLVLLGCPPPTPVDCQCRQPSVSCSSASLGRAAADSCSTCGAVCVIVSCRQHRLRAFL